MAGDERHSMLAVLGTVAFYMVVAISMTLLNKSVLSSTPLPVFLLFCQSGVGIILLAAENKFGPMKTPRFDSQVAKGLIPLTVVNALSLIFNNYCLQYVDASFHQVARGLHLPATIMITIISLNQWPTFLSLIAALIVTSGFFAGIILDPDVASSHATAAISSSSTATLGILSGAASSVLSAYHAVLIKRGLNLVNGSTIALSYYNNILSTASLVPLVILTGEAPGALKIFIAKKDAGDFLWGAAITGLFGFLISLAAMISIKVTSPVTHMFSSAARGVLQTLLAVYFFGDVMSTGRVTSIFLIIFGSVLYVYSKSASSETTKAPQGDLKFNEKGSENGLLSEKREMV